MTLENIENWVENLEITTSYRIQKFHTQHEIRR